MTEADKKITKARAGLVLDEPFFGALALKLKPVESELNESGWTDGVHLGYNPKWIEDMPLDKVKGFIAHEVMHLAFGHQARRQSRDPKKWNESADFSVNNILTEAGFNLPDNGLVHSGFADKSTEEIYTLLPDAQDNGDGQGGGQSITLPDGSQVQVGSGKDPGGCGEILDAPGSGPKEQPASANELKKSETDWKVAATQAAQAAKTMGNLPGAIKKAIIELLEPKLNWRELLRDFIERSAKNDYTWKHPNRRYISQGIILPSLNSKEIGTACVAIDTSGSVSEGELKQFASEVNSILEEYQDITVDVIYCDTRVAHVDRFHSTDMPIEMTMHGGGGTDFRPPFKWVEDNVADKPTCLIYFTDMECNSFPDDPGYPVIWVQTETMYSGSHWGDVPFGEIVTMNMKGEAKN